MSESRNPTSEEISKQLDLYQGIISRISSNSSNSKNWCVTVISAILVFTTASSHPRHSWIAIFPLISFCIMDVYYLAIEKSSVSQHELFVAKIHDGTLKTTDLFKVRPIPKGFYLKSLKSPSIYIFYPPLAILIVTAYFIHN